MSEKFKIFIFTDMKTGRILLVKKSVEVEFQIHIDGVRSQEIKTDVELPAIKPLVQSYNPAKGFQTEKQKLSQIENQRLSLLRRKVEVTILMITSVHLVKKDIRVSFSEKELAQFPVNRKNFRKFWLFMAQEKRLLFSRVHKFMKDYYHKMNSIHSISGVNEYYDYLRLNLNLGVYSAMNRERKGIGGKKN